MKANEAFHPDDLSGLQRGGHHRQGIFRNAADMAVPIPKFQIRTALATSVQLLMESAVERTLILATTLFTHGELAHGCIRSIIRKAFDDGKPWPAVHAVGKWIEIATVRRIENLREAIGTGRDVDGYCGLLRAGVRAVADFENSGAEWAQ